MMLLNVILLVCFIVNLKATAFSYVYKGSFCYDDVIIFPESPDSCDFKDWDIKNQIEGRSSNCSEKCMLLTKDSVIALGSQYQVTNIHATFHTNGEKHTFTLESPRCNRTDINKMILNIVCGIQMRSGESFIACNKEKRCFDERADCKDLTNNGHGRCICKDRSMYIRNGICNCNTRQIRHKDTCIDAHKALFESCTIDAQCTATRGAGLCRLFGERKRCYCSNENIFIKGTCKEANKGLNENCEFDAQCNLTRGANQCTFLGTRRICQCSKRYVSIGGTCRKGIRLLGDSCEVHEQCSGTKNAGVCKDSAINNASEKKCQCDANFVQNHRSCLPGNLSAEESCIHSSQCTGTENAGRCIDEICQCNEGYILKESKCFRGKLPLGNNCQIHEQCSGTKNAGICNYAASSKNQSPERICHCNKGYLQVLQGCLPDNLSVGQSCVHSSQCSGTENAGLCVDGICLCSNGYYLKKLECLKTGLLRQEICKYDEQCTGTKDAGRCHERKGICVCDIGYKWKKGQCTRNVVMKMLLGDSCVVHEDCSGTKNAGLCKISVADNNITAERKCHCNPGFVEFFGHCILGNLSVGHTCIHSSQCTDTENAGRCVDGVCTCNKGYIYSRMELECVTVKESEKGAPRRKKGIIFGAIGYFLGLMSTALALVFFKICWVRPKKRNRRELNLPQNQLNDYSESELLERETTFLQSLTRNDHGENPYSSIGYAYNHLHENIDTTLETDIYDFATPQKNDQADDSYDLAKNVQF